MKSYSVTIQMKPRPQYFHMVLFVFQHITKRKLGSFLEFLFWPLLVLKGILSEHLTNDFSGFLPRLAL